MLMQGPLRIVKEVPIFGDKGEWSESIQNFLSRNEIVVVQHELLNVEMTVAVKVVQMVTLGVPLHKDQIQILLSLATMDEVATV